MTITEFFAQRPCLEEIEGYRDQKVRDGRWSDEDQARFLVYQERLTTGKETPYPSKLERAWDYQQKRKPKRSKAWQTSQRENSVRS